MEDARKLSDFIDLDLLQNIQDNCSKAMGLAFITVDYKGIPITKYSGFTSHCMLGRQAKGFAEMCEQCDAHGGLHAAITGQPYIYRCHADLVDFAVPLIVNGSYMERCWAGRCGYRRRASGSWSTSSHSVPIGNGIRNGRRLTRSWRSSPMKKWRHL